MARSLSIVHAGQPQLSMEAPPPAPHSVRVVRVGRVVRVVRVVRGGDKLTAGRRPVLECGTDRTPQRQCSCLPEWQSAQAVTS